MRNENPPFKTEQNVGRQAVEPVQPDRKFPTSRGVLSKAEIEALLRPDLSDMPGETPSSSVTPRAIDPVPTAAQQAEQARRIEAGQTAARLSLTLGQCSGIKTAIGLQKVERLPDGDRPLPLNGRSGAALCFGARDDSLEAVIALSGDLADAIIAKACGAPPGVMDSGRLGDGWTLSAIDCALLEQLLAPLGPAVRSDLRLIAIETDMRYVSSLLPPHQLSRAVFSVEAPGLTAQMSLILRAPDDAAARPQIDQARLPLTALLTARMASLSVPLSRITALKAGSTLLLGLPPDQPVEVLSGGRDGPVVMEGAVGRKGNRIAVRITGVNRSLIKDSAS